MTKKCSVYIFFKRILDLGLASATIVVLLPLLVPIIIILRLTGVGEIFYLQERIGFKNSRFKIWNKFFRESPTRRWKNRWRM